MPPALPRGLITLQTPVFSHIVKDSLCSVTLPHAGDSVEIPSEQSAELLYTFSLVSWTLKAVSIAWFSDEGRGASLHAFWQMEVTDFHLFLLHLFSYLLPGSPTVFVFVFRGFCLFLFLRVLARNYMQIILCRELSEVPLWVCVS